MIHDIQEIQEIVWGAQLYNFHYNLFTSEIIITGAKMETEETTLFDVTFSGVHCFLNNLDRGYNSYTFLSIGLFDIEIEEKKEEIICRFGDPCEMEIKCKKVVLTPKGKFLLDKEGWQSSVKKGDLFR